MLCGLLVGRPGPTTAFGRVTRPNAVVGPGRPTSGLLFVAAQELLPCGIVKASKPSRTKSLSKIGVF